MEISWWIEISHVDMTIPCALEIYTPGPRWTVNQCSRGRWLVKLLRLSQCNCKIGDIIKHDRETSNYHIWRCNWNGLYWSCSRSNFGMVFRASDEKHWILTYGDISGLNQIVHDEYATVGSYFFWNYNRNTFCLIYDDTSELLIFDTYVTARLHFSRIMIEKQLSIMCDDVFKMIRTVSVQYLIVGIFDVKPKTRNRNYTLNLKPKTPNTKQ